jgi:uncharacterized membrane protein
MMAAQDLQFWLNEPALVVLAYGLLALIALLTGATLVRSVLASILALFGSGYSLSAVLFPRARQLDAVERAAVSAGLSLALGGIIGFLLSVLPWGLETGPLFVSIVLFNLACYVLVVIRRWHLPLEELPVWNGWLAHAGEWWRRQDGPSRRSTVVLTIVLLAGAGALYIGATTPGIDPPLTEFYLTNPSGTVVTFPTQGRVGENTVLTYTIANHEHEQALYEVRAFVNGALVGIGQPTRLGPGVKYTAELELVWTEQEVGTQKVDVVLYRGREPYRSLHLWLEVRGAGAG